MEEFANTHRKYNPFIAAYPENCVYKSVLIENLRTKYVVTNGQELEPTLNKKRKSEYFDSPTMNAFRDKMIKRRALEIAMHEIKDIDGFYSADSDLSTKKHLLYKEFIKYGENLGYSFDKKGPLKTFQYLF